MMQFAGPEIMKTIRRGLSRIHLKRSTGLRRDGHDHVDVRGGLRMLGVEVKLVEHGTVLSETSVANVFSRLVSG